MPKPCIVIVPGAWHSTLHYNGLIVLFQQAGYQVSSQKLPSVNPDVPANHTSSTDAAFIRERLLLPLVEDGTDVLLVMHSYGGCPGAAAAKGLSTKDRTADGKTGGIIGLIFIAAFLHHQGDCVFNCVGGKWESWHCVDVGQQLAPLRLVADLLAKYMHDQLSSPMQEKTGLIRPANPQTIMYGDVPEYLAADAASALLPLSLHVFTNPSPAPAWADAAYSGRRAYIRCSQDICLPTFVQDIMVEASGVDWIKKTFDTSHSPFLSCPTELADYVLALAVAFAK
jgi:pimeloyl-ACP methyl ester carboxylesterase